MASRRDEAGLTDDFAVTLNGVPVDTGPRRVPPRPGPRAPKPEVLAYVVALGAPVDIAEETEHWDASKGHKVKVPGLTVSELFELADRLGG